jgi:hypothetical protein
MDNYSNQTAFQRIIKINFFLYKNYFHNILKKVLNKNQNLFVNLSYLFMKKNHYNF